MNAASGAEGRSASDAWQGTPPKVSRFGLTAQISPPNPTAFVWPIALAAPSPPMKAAVFGDSRRRIAANRSMGPGYRPFQTGSRFSAKARAPSSWSSLV